MKTRHYQKDPEFSNVIIVLGIAITANILCQSMSIDLGDTLHHIQRQIVACL